MVQPRLSFLVSHSAGLKLLRDFGNVDTSYNLTPEQLCEKIASADALIIRSATQVAFPLGRWL